MDFDMKISERKYEIEKRRRAEREVLLKEHNERFEEEMYQLRQDCAKEGHVRGNYWNNGLGWEWYYCAKCGASFDKNYYLEEKDQK